MPLKKYVWLKKKINPSKQLIKITEDGLKPGSYGKYLLLAPLLFWDLNYSDRHKLQHMVVGGRGIVSHTHTHTHAHERGRGRDRGKAVKYETGASKFRYTIA